MSSPVNVVDDDCVCIYTVYAVTVFICLYLIKFVVIYVFKITRIVFIFLFFFPELTIVLMATKKRDNFPELKWDSLLTLFRNQLCHAVYSHRFLTEDETHAQHINNV